MNDNEHKIRSEAIKEFALSLSQNISESSGMNANSAIIVLRMIKNMCKNRKVESGEKD